MPPAVNPDNAPDAPESDEAAAIHCEVTSVGLVTETENPVMETSQFKELDGDALALKEGVKVASVSVRLPELIAAVRTVCVTPLSL